MNDQSLAQGHDYDIETDNVEGALRALDRKSSLRTASQCAPRKHRSLMRLPFIGRRVRESVDYGTPSAVSYENDPKPTSKVGMHPQKPPSTLKKTLSRAFSRSYSSIVEFPAQHVVAQRDHFNRSSNVESDNWTQHNPHMLQYNIPIHREPMNTGYEPSRVTSWANSSVHNTMVAAYPLDMLQKIVDTTNSPQISVQDFAADRGEEKLRKRTSKFDVREIVDSHRVFSALMRRIEAKKLPYDHDRSSATDDTRETLQKETTAPFATIKRIPLDIRGEQYDAVISEAVDDDQIQLSARHDAMSPSIYSSHNTTYHFSKESIQPDLGLSGTALVTSSEPISTWNLAKRDTSVKPNTSNDWRNWASGELASLARAASFGLIKPSGSLMKQNHVTHRREHAGIEDVEASSLRLPSTNSRFFTLERIPSSIDSAISSSHTPKTHQRERSEIQNAESSNWRLGNTNSCLPASKFGSRVSSWNVSVDHETDSRLLMEDKIMDCAHVSGSEHPASGSASFHDRDQPPPVPIHRTFKIPFTISAETEARRNIDLSPIKEDTYKSPALHKYISKSQHEVSSVPADMYSYSSDFRTRRAAVPKGQLDDNFLRRIRKGPYTPLTPSPNKAAGHRGQSLVDFSIQPPTKPGLVNCENTPPSAGSRHLVNKFLEARSRYSIEDSPPAFL